MTVKRFDRATIEKPAIDQNGYLHADAAVTKAGVFVYHHPDGSTTKELRHPDEVFKADSLATMENRPLTDGHPAEGRLDPKNTKRLSVGTLIEKPERNDIFVNTRLMITDQVAIDKIMREESPVRELSCGYNCDTIKESGMYAGEQYDHIQKNIIYNHVAIVEKGRAGPNARLVLDVADAAAEGFDIELKQDNSNRENKTMLKIKRVLLKTPTFKLDAVDLKIDDDSENGFTVITDQLDSAVGHIGKLEGKNDELQGKNDTLQGQIDELKAKAIIPPEKLAGMVSERADVLGVAHHVGVETKLDDIDNAGVKKLIVAAKSPDAKLDDASSGYIQGRYDTIIDGIRADNEGLKSLAALGAITSPVGENLQLDEDEGDDLSPREQFCADSQDMWKKED